MLDSQKRIAGAFLVGATLVAVTFVMGGRTVPPSPSGSLSATVVEREYVKPTDSNGDGVPNWQEELLQEDTIVVPAASSTYKEPNTVTGKFALRFFEDFVRSNMYGAFGKSKEEIAQQSAQVLIDQAVDELLTEKDITHFDTDSTQALRVYANQVALILTAHPNTNDNEAIILQDYLRYGKPERLKEIEPIALAYTTIVKNLLETQVPQAYVKQHLDLLNALNAVREDVRGMQKIEDDPMYTLVRFKRYPDDVLGMSNAISNLFNALYLEGGVRFDVGDPVLKLMVFPS